MAKLHKEVKSRIMTTISENYYYRANIKESREKCYIVAVVDKKRK
jgi:RNase P/RNase MRP subunit p30